MDDACVVGPEVRVQDPLESYSIRVFGPEKVIIQRKQGEKQRKAHQAAMQDVLQALGSPSSRWYLGHFHHVS